MEDYFSQYGYDQAVYNTPKEVKDTIKKTTNQNNPKEITPEYVKNLESKVERLETKDRTLEQKINQLVITVNKLTARLNNLEKTANNIHNQY